MSVKISPTNSQLLYGARPLALANGVDGVAIKIILRDENNQPVIDRQAELIPDRDDFIVIQPGLSNNTGLAVGYVKSTIVGPVKLRARVAGRTNPRVLTSAEALQELSANPAGAVWLDDTITINFYDRGIDPQPVLESTAGRNIHVQWFVSRHYINDIDGIRVRIQIDDAILMPTKIFAYQVLPVKPGDTEALAAFDHVCSVVDLEEYPEDAPNESDRPAWFRADYVDIFLRSQEEVRAFIAAVLEDIKILKNTLDISDNLLPAGEVWIAGDIGEE